MLYSTIDLKLLLLHNEKNKFVSSLSQMRPAHVNHNRLLIIHVSTKPLYISFTLYWFTVSTFVLASVKNCNSWKVYCMGCSASCVLPQKISPTFNCIWLVLHHYFVFIRFRLEDLKRSKYSTSIENQCSGKTLQLSDTDIKCKAKLMYTSTSTPPDFTD